MPTKNHSPTSRLATKVTSATEPMAMMSVHEMWLDTSSVARPVAGWPITVTRSPRNTQPTRWKKRGSTFQNGSLSALISAWPGMTTMSTGM